MTTLTTTALESPTALTTRTATTGPACHSSSTIALMLEVIEECGGWNDETLEGWASWLRGEVARAETGGAPASRIEELRTMLQGVQLVLGARRGPIAA